MINNDTESTPLELINLLTLNNKPLQELPNSSLTEYIHETTYLFRCPMSAYATGSHRRTQIFVCRYGGNSRGTYTWKCGCNCKIEYYIDDYSRVSLISAQWNHNHPVSQAFFEAHSSCLTKEEKEKIVQQQNLGLQPAKIRENLNLTINPDVFYNIRRKAIKENNK